MIAGALVVGLAGRQFWRLREMTAVSPSSPWTGLAIGSSILLSGLTKLTRPSALSTAADAISLICLVAAIVLLYRQMQRRPVK